MIAFEYISLNTLLEVKNYDGYNNQGKNVMVEPTKPYQESSSIHNSSLPLRQLSINHSSFPLLVCEKGKVWAKGMAHQWHESGDITKKSLKKTYSPSLITNRL